MLSYEFKTYISNDTEHYYRVVRSLEDSTVRTGSDTFPSALISFLDLDVESFAPVFQKIADLLWSLTLTKETRFADEAKDLLLSLVPVHIYFEFLCLDWSWHIDHAVMLDDYSENVLDRYGLIHMAEELASMQRQVSDLFAEVLDADSEDWQVEEKLTAYYKAASEEPGRMFEFRPQPMSYELMNDEVFTEVLCPQTIHDLVDYHLRECLKRQVRMRRCKNCGRWFALTGHLGVEYCDRPIDDRGHTCRSLGAAIQWTIRKKEDVVFADFRREYKKRFGWIRKGKITKLEFYKWSAAAQKKRKECEAGKITAEEFGKWLAES